MRERERERERECALYLFSWWVPVAAARKNDLWSVVFRGAPFCYLCESADYDEACRNVNPRANITSCHSRFKEIIFLRMRTNCSQESLRGWLLSFIIQYTISPYQYYTYWTCHLVKYFMLYELLHIFNHHYFTIVPVILYYTVLHCYANVITLLSRVALSETYRWISKLHVASRIDLFSRHRPSYLFV